ncbi:MAG: hypothetical protein II749_02705 [Clostridia bacterium]|nr:hypothetical protein [Clostridia bacterium]
MQERQYERRELSDLSYERRRQLEDYRKEAEGLEEIRILCPICQKTVDIVFSDARGHKRIKCSRCRKDFVITLPRFRIKRR